MPTTDLWHPDHPAVWWELVHEDLVQGKKRAITLRHPAYPFEDTLHRRDDRDELLAIAARYLEKVREAFGLPPLFASPGRFGEQVPLAWLPIDPAEPPAPRASFWIRRYDDPSTPPIDTRVILLAVESRTPNNPDDMLGSRLGIRIVAHVARGDHPKVRITGAACSAELPGHLTSVRRGLNAAVFASFFEQLFFNPVLREQLKTSIRPAVPLAHDVPVWIDGVRARLAPERGFLIELYSTTPRPADETHGVAYALTTQFTLAAMEELPAVETFPLVANATPVRVRLFPRDPASMAGLGRLVEARPNRSPARLQGFRRFVGLPGLEVDANGDTILLDRGGHVQVMQSVLVDPPGDESQTEVVRPAAVSHSRMNPFAALSGYQRARAHFNQQHARPLFDTMYAYGLSPILYFRLARRPLLVRYRAPIRPGPGKDGKTVNAQVDYDPPGCDLVVNPWNPATREPLQVRFALADLKRSASRREPLGLAADPRWSWHEYCHVLLAAVTGRLELVFSHSAGDALAAILGDPWSRLAWGRDSWIRGYTFPWVYLHRRHDRSVYDGWSWSGRYHRPARFDPVNSNCRHKGYDSEQILSTSLFRLYRALGGDTVRPSGRPDRPARQAAADYTAYLILLSIGLLPWAGAAQLETPDQLVSLLTDADVGTWPGVPGPIHGRVGGCAYKVVRWAFEAQGLYATTDPLAVIDAPGNPPDVDVFIDDRRPDSEGSYPRGGYTPVSLDRHGQGGRPPDWHASRAAIHVANGQVTVQVRNRGRSRADDVTVQVWWTDWPANQPLPDWHAWTDLGSSAKQSVPAWPTNPPVTFGPFPGIPRLPSGRRVLILAAATCSADPANNDPATGLPSSRVPTPLVDLVAGDNNLGLRLHRVP